MHVESYPGAEPEEDAAEQPDLLGAYGEQIVTIHGISGSLKDLAGLCPVDPNDPRRTIEADNEFVVKVANEAGLAIAPEHEPLFSRVLEKHHLEQKITIARSDIIQKGERERTQTTSALKRGNGNPTDKQKVAPAAPESADQQSRSSAIEQSQRAAAETSAMISEKMAEDSKLIREQEKPGNTLQREILARPEAIRPADQPMEALLFTEARERTEGSAPAASVATRTTAQLPRTEAEKPLPPTSISTFAPERLTKHPHRPAKQKIETDYRQPFVQNESALPLQRLKIELTSPDEIPPAEILTDPRGNESNMAPGQTEQLSVWTAGPEGEPATTYKDFTRALQAFISQPRDAETTIWSNQEDGTYGIAENQETPTVPVIAITVAERLVELDPDRQADIAPLLQVAVGANAELQRWDIPHGKADPEARAAAEASLETAIITFFEAIGIEYKAADVQEFAHLLQRPNIQAPLIEIDLAHAGTHETKAQRSQLTQNLADAERNLQQLVGRLAFFCLKRAGYTVSIPASIAGQLPNAA
jgi:hypothetical protein